MPRNLNCKIHKQHRLYIETGTVMKYFKFSIQAVSEGSVIQRYRLCLHGSSGYAVLAVLQ